jgi:hypothetical protein
MALVLALHDLRRQVTDVGDASAVFSRRPYEQAWRAGAGRWCLILSHARAWSCFLSVQNAPLLRRVTHLGVAVEGLPHLPRPFSRASRGPAEEMLKIPLSS